MRAMTNCLTIPDACSLGEEVYTFNRIAAAAAPLSRPWNIMNYPFFFLGIKTFAFNQIIMAQ